MSCICGAEDPVLSQSLSDSTTTLNMIQLALLRKKLVSRDHTMGGTKSNKTTRACRHQVDNYNALLSRSHLM